MIYDGTMIDLGWRQTGAAKRLSNFAPHGFVMDDIVCGGMEGWLQSLKFYEPLEQARIAGMTGYEAYRFGQGGNDWQDSQLLWWCKKPYDRFSSEYKDLITHAYDICFDNNVDFRNALIETGTSELSHSIGRHDPTKTVLTETEYLYQIYRLRAKAYGGIL